MSDQEITTLIQGRQIKLDSGALVWGGISNNSIVWKFTSKDGATTTVGLSKHAMRAIVHIYQGLIGCDESFASIDIAAPDKATGDL